MKLSVRELVLFAILGSILTVGQVAFGFLPNIEIVSFLIILFTLIYEKKAIYSVMVFVILEGVFYGIGPWWFGYICIWPTLVLLTLLLRNWLKEDFLRLSIFSAGFAILFGALFALPYVLIGNFTYALTFWINGLPFDLIHMVGNYFVMLILGEVVYKNLCKLNTLHIYKLSS